MNRRHFINLASLATVPASLDPGRALAPLERAPRILLRSSWQSVNIGDIGHTPGALSLLDRYFPEAEITLWPNDLGHGAHDLLTRNYPRLKIVEGTLDPTGKPSTPALARAWAETDMYLGGSGSGFPSSAHAASFLRATGKPVGILAVSTDPVSPACRNSAASHTANHPFSASRANTRYPHSFPRIRPTLVAPMLPEPWARMSTPQARASSKPQGIDPRRKPKSGQNQSCIRGRGSGGRGAESSRENGSGTGAGPSWRRSSVRD